MADLRAKRSKALDLLKQDLTKGFIESEVSVFGHKFVLRTLTEDDEVWADSYVRISSPVAILSSQKAPQLAAAIKSMDGIPTESLFEYPDDMEKARKEELDSNPVLKRYWIYTQMLYFLSEDGNRPFISKLHAEYDKLTSQRNEALNKIPN